MEKTSEDKRISGRKRLSRRDFLRLSGAGLAGVSVLGAAACGGGGGDSGGPVNVVFSFGPDDSGTLQELVEHFNQQNQGEIQVEYRQMPRSTDAYFDELVSSFQAGEGDIDVIGGDVIWGAEFAENGWISDLTRRLRTDYEPQGPEAFLNAQIQSVSYENSLWGVPWFSDAGLLYYRRDLLEEGGFSEPPATWGELKDMAGRVKEQAGTRYGFVFQGAEYEGGVVNGCEHIWNAGGRILTGNISTASPGSYSDINDPNVINIDSSDSARGLRTERSMIEDGVSPQEVASWREQESQQAFFAGDSVFLRGWPYMYALPEDTNTNVSQDQVGIAPLPVAEEGMQSYSCLGGWNMYINSASEKKDAAWEFIKFATSPEQQKFRALEGSFLPSLRDLYDDQEILDQVAVIRLAKDIVVQQGQGPSLRARPVTPFYSTISRRLASGYNATLRGEIPPERAVEMLQEELRNVVSR